MDEEYYYYYLVEITLINGEVYDLAVGFLKETPEWTCQKLFRDWLSDILFVSIHSGGFDELNISVRHIMKYEFKVQRYDYDDLGMSVYNLE